MGSTATRSVFVASLCAGVAMVGVSVNGLLGVDAELARSAQTAQTRAVETKSVRVVEHSGWGCDDRAPDPRTRLRT